jgi:hypothetical protein
MDELLDTKDLHREIRGMEAVAMSDDSFRKWLYSDPKRQKYDNLHPVYIVAEWAWKEASKELESQLVDAQQRAEIDGRMIAELDFGAGGVLSTLHECKKQLAAEHEGRLKAEAGCAEMPKLIRKIIGNALGYEQIPITPSLEECISTAINNGFDDNPGSYLLEQIAAADELLKACRSLDNIRLGLAADRYEALRKAKK